MKHFLLTIAFCVQLVQAKAYNFLTEYVETIQVEVLNNFDTTDMDRSSIWYSQSWTEEHNYPRPLVLDVIQVIKDTLLDDRYSYVIGVTSKGIYYPESELPVYTKDGKFYFHEDDGWWLLYDFTAQEGDTVSYYISKRYKYYSLGMVPMLLENSKLLEYNPHKYIVTKIDSVYDNNGKPVKRFILDSWLNESDHYFETILEHVGAINRLMGSYVYFSTEDRLPLLRCYSDAEYTFHFTDEACDQISSTDNFIKSHIHLHPNPGLDVLFLENSSDKVYECSIFSPHGVQVFLGKINIGQNTIPTSDFPKGFYTILIRNHEGNISALKWVKI